MRARAPPWTLAILLAASSLAAPLSRADPATHAVASPVLAPGGVYANPFTAPGDYEYHCHIHPAMMGVVHVAANARIGGPATHTVRIWDAGNQSRTDSMGFLDDQTKLPETAVSLGDSVVWINEGKLSHDVAILEPTGAAAHDQGAFEVAVAAAAVAAVGVILWSRLRRG